MLEKCKKSVEKGVYPTRLGRMKRPRHKWHTWLQVWGDGMHQWGLGFVRMRDKAAGKGRGGWLLPHAASAIWIGFLFPIAAASACIPHPSSTNRCFSLAELCWVCCHGYWQLFYTPTTTHLHHYHQCNPPHTPRFIIVDSSNRIFTRIITNACLLWNLLSEIKWSLEVW